MLVLLSLPVATGGTFRNLSTHLLPRPATFLMGVKTYIQTLTIPFRLIFLLCVLGDPFTCGTRRDSVPIGRMIPANQRAVGGIIMRGVATAFATPPIFRRPSHLAHGICRKGLGADGATTQLISTKSCVSMGMFPKCSPNVLRRSFAGWRAARRGSGNLGKCENDGYVGGGVGGGRRELEVYSGGSGPPRSPRQRRWGRGGGDDGGAGGEDNGSRWIGSSLAAYISVRRSRHGSYGEGGGRRGSYGRQTYRRRGRSSNGEITMTQLVTALNVIVFLLQMRFPSITAAGWKLASAISREGQWYRLLTPVVLHGSLMHLMINSMSLNSVGPVVEKVMGKAKFMLIYLLAGVSGNALSCVVNPRMPAVGASGAIFGMVGAWTAFCIMNRAVMGRENAQRSLAAVGQTLAFNLFLGMSSSQIDNMGHVGGFLGGVIATFFVGPRLKRRWNPLTGEPYTVDLSMRLSLPRLGKGGSRDRPTERPWP